MHIDINSELDILKKKRAEIFEPYKMTKLYKALSINPSSVRGTTEIELLQESMKEIENCLDRINCYNNNNIEDSIEKTIRKADSLLEKTSDLCKIIDWN